MDHPDPLTIIAESYALTAQIQMLLARLQVLALLLLGVALLVLGFTVWQHVLMSQDSAALHRLILTNTQTIEAQTRTLLERLSQR